MLEEVHITGLGVIDDAVLELSSGFTALTGETGAGKTMVVTALGLLFGGRATLLTPRGGRMLSAFVEKPENEPFRRAQDERVTLEILSTVRVAGDTWQVDWRESSWDKNGAPMGGPG